MASAIMEESTPSPRNLNGAASARWDSEELMLAEEAYSSDDDDDEQDISGRSNSQALFSTASLPQFASEESVDAYLLMRHNSTHAGTFGILTGNSVDGVPLSRQCRNCGITESEDHMLWRCRVCRKVLYCSRDCQMEDWDLGGHRSECKDLRTDTNRPMVRSTSTKLTSPLELVGSQIPTKGTLRVDVVECKNLPIADFNSSDPYVKLKLVGAEPERAQTRVIQKDLNPVFDETFVFQNVSIDTPLEVKVKDSDVAGSDDMLGVARVDLKALQASLRSAPGKDFHSDHWYLICEDSKKNPDAAVRLKLHFNFFTLAESTSGDGIAGATPSIAVRMLSDKKVQESHEHTDSESDDSTFASHDTSVKLGPTIKSAQSEDSAHGDSDGHTHALRHSASGRVEARRASFSFESHPADATIVVKTPQWETISGSVTWKFSFQLYDFSLIVDLKKAFALCARAQTPGVPDGTFTKALVRLEKSAVVFRDEHPIYFLAQGLDPGDLRVINVRLDPYPYAEEPSFSGDLLKQGKLFHAWSKRFFVLNSGRVGSTLRYGRSRTSLGKPIPMRSFELWNHEKPSLEFELHISLPDDAVPGDRVRTMNLQAQTPFQKGLWLKELRLLYTSTMPPHDSEVPVGRCQKCDRPFSMFRSAFTCSADNLDYCADHFSAHQGLCVTHLQNSTAIVRPKHGRTLMLLPSQIVHAGGFDQGLKKQDSEDSAPDMADSQAIAIEQALTSSALMAHDRHDGGDWNLDGFLIWSRLMLDLGVSPAPRLQLRILQARGLLIDESDVQSNRYSYYEDSDDADDTNHARQNGRTKTKRSLEARAKAATRALNRVVDRVGLEEVSNAADLHVRVFVEEQELRTDAAPDPREPSWQDTFDLQLRGAGSHAHLAVFVRSEPARPRFLGMVYIPLYSLTNEALYDRWYALCPRPGRYGQSDSISGAVRIQIRFSWSPRCLVDPLDPAPEGTTSVDTFSRAASLVRMKGIDKDGVQSRVKRVDGVRGAGLAAFKTRLKAVANKVDGVINDGKKEKKRKRRRKKEAKRARLSQRVLAHNAVRVVTLFEMIHYAEFKAWLKRLLSWQNPLLTLFCLVTYVMMCLYFPLRMVLPSFPIALLCLMFLNFMEAGLPMSFAGSHMGGYVDHVSKYTRPDIVPPVRPPRVAWPPFIPQPKRRGSFDGGGSAEISRSVSPISIVSPLPGGSVSTKLIAEPSTSVVEDTKTSTEQQNVVPLQELSAASAPPAVDTSRFVTPTKPRPAESTVVSPSEQHSDVKYPDIEDGSPMLQSPNSEAGSPKHQSEVKDSALAVDSPKPQDDASLSPLSRSSSAGPKNRSRKRSTGRKRGLSRASTSSTTFNHLWSLDPREQANLSEWQIEERLHQNEVLKETMTWISDWLGATVHIAEKLNSILNWHSNIHALVFAVTMTLLCVVLATVELRHLLVVFGVYQFLRFVLVYLIARIMGMGPGSDPDVYMREHDFILNFIRRAPSPWEARLNVRNLPQALKEVDAA